MICRTGQICIVQSPAMNFIFSKLNYTVFVSLARIRPHYFPHCVFFISPHHEPVPVQSSLRVKRLWRHSRCPSDMLVPDLVFSACHSVHPL